MSCFFDVGNGICQVLKKFNPTCNIKQNIYRILAVQDEVLLFGDSLCTFSCISVTTGYWILDTGW